MILSKPQIMVESTFGDSHPGSAHLESICRDRPCRRVRTSTAAKPPRYFATDICDGIAQGHDGINYSLAHRDAIADLIEVHANASGI